MRQLLAASAVLSVVAFSAAAQETNTVIKRVGVPLPVMGNVVKGAPYSAEEVTESAQVLADGTRISNQSQVTVYRDGEGRVRRETPTQITIWDPKEGVGYTLDPKAMTAVKTVMGRAFSVSTAAGDKQAIEIAIRDTKVALDRMKTVEVQASAAQLEKMKVEQATVDKLKAEMAASGNVMVINGVQATPQANEAMKDQLMVAIEKMTRAPGATPGRSENLGQRVMEGVTVEGTRMTSTIDAGVIGNDRPINIVSERWYSSELQAPVYTKRTDPRTGEEIFRLQNVRRGEPPTGLFLLPPGYQIESGPAERLMYFNTVKKE